MANNDTEFPKNWDIMLMESFTKFKKIGLVSPVYTSGARKIALRNAVGKNQDILEKARLPIERMLNA